MCDTIRIRDLQSEEARLLKRMEELSKQIKRVKKKDPKLAEELVKELHKTGRRVDKIQEKLCEPLS